MQHSKNSLLTFVGFKKSTALAMLAAAPGIVACLIFLYVGAFDVLETVTILTAVLGPWLALTVLYYRSALRPWQSVANILSSFREQDYSIRSVVKDSDDVVNVVMRELNNVSEHLRSNRIAITETQKLLGRILTEADIAIFLFDDKHDLVMVNRFGAALYKETATELEGQSINALGLTFAQRAAHTSVHEHRFANREGRWLIKHSVYRHQGLQHQFIMLADIGKNLRQEELEAWRRLVRILSHEINNSLTPLKATTGSMARMLKREHLANDWREDFNECLDIIDGRTDHLSHLVNSYGEMARLPEPNLAPVSIGHLLNSLARSYGNPRVVFQMGADITVNIDKGQIEQVLLNLIKNALEASGEADPVVLSYSADNQACEIVIDDSGSGVENSDNLFVPYYSTKPKGSGIGLVVSRQIVEAHGGSLRLDNHIDLPGCRASIRLLLGQL